MADVELDSMAQISQAMEGLDDHDARERVRTWAIQKFCPDLMGTFVTKRSIAPAASRTISARLSQNHGLADIVEMDADGRLRVIARDLKARSTSDAAIRLAHIVVYAYEQLTGQRDVSSRQVLLPVLKEWRAYDGNTRPALARHPGIKRNGDLLSLDLHSKRDAEKFISEIRDESITGAWTSARAGQRRATRNRGISKAH